MGVFYELLTTLAINSGFSNFESLIVLVLFFAGLLLHIGSFIRGAMINAVLFSGIVMFFHYMELEYKLPLIIMFLYFIILTISLLFENRTSSTIV